MRTPSPPPRADDMAHLWLGARPLTTLAHRLTRGAAARAGARWSAALGFALASALGCGGARDDEAREEGSAAAHAPAGDELVAYDVRRLRPTDEPLRDRFDRLLAQASAQGRRVAVLFSADWCHACRDLAYELGNLQPARTIGDVRIFELLEEDWEGAMRGDEFNALRLRWHPAIGTYPYFLLLDEHGGAVEEMKQAADRLQAAGLEPSLVAWFENPLPPPVP